MAQRDTLFAGRYRIVGVVARGGMGVVFRAVDTCLERPVALKTVAGEEPELVTRHRATDRPSGSRGKERVDVDFGRYDLTRSGAYQASPRSGNATTVRTPRS